MANEVMTAGSGTLSRLEELGKRAQILVTGAAMNLLQLGQVIDEAKGIAQRGEWPEWVRVNTGLSLRMAEHYAKCYREFGLDSSIATLAPSKVLKLAAVVPEEREKLMAENDVQGMTVKELDAAIKEQRGAFRSPPGPPLADKLTKKDLDRAVDAARDEERKRARESMEALRESNLAELAKVKEAADQVRKDEAAVAKLKQEALIREMTEAQKAQMAEKEAEIERQRATIDQLKATAQAAMDGAGEWRTERAEVERREAKARRDLEDANEALREMQEEYDRMREELREAQGQIARGDAGKGDREILSGEAVAEAVGLFLSRVGRVPYMHGAFAAMETEELELYRADVLQVKEWAEKSLKAMETVNGIGGVD